MPVKSDGSVIAPPERFANVLRGSQDDPGDHRPTRRLAWVGEQSPLRNEVIAARLALGVYTPLQEQALRIAASRALTAVKGGRRRVLEHVHAGALCPIAGLSRTYRWTEPDFVTEVAYADVDLILSLSCAHEFADLDAREGDQPPPEPPLPPPLIPYQAIGGLRAGAREVPLDVAQITGE